MISNKGKQTEIILTAFMHSLFNTVCSKVSLSLLKSSEGVWTSAQWAVNKSFSLEYYVNNLCEKEAHSTVNIPPQASHLKG